MRIVLRPRQNRGACVKCDDENHYFRKELLLRTDLMLPNCYSSLRDTNLLHLGTGDVSFYLWSFGGSRAS